MAEGFRFGSIAEGLEGEVWWYSESVSDHCESCKPGVPESRGVVVAVGWCANGTNFECSVTVWVRAAAGVEDVGARVEGDTLVVGSESADGAIWGRGAKLG